MRTVTGTIHVTDGTQVEDRVREALGDYFGDQPWRLLSVETTTVRDIRDRVLHHEVQYTAERITPP